MALSFNFNGSSCPYACIFALVSSRFMSRHFAVFVIYYVDGRLGVNKELNLFIFNVYVYCRCLSYIKTVLFLSIFA